MGIGGMPSTMSAEFGCTLCADAGGPLGAFCASIEHDKKMRNTTGSLRLMALPLTQTFYQKKRRFAAMGGDADRSGPSARSYRGTPPFLDSFTRPNGFNTPLSMLSILHSQESVLGS